jgi:hypothetical protein
MGTFFSREEAETAVAPTPQGDKMGPYVRWWVGMFRVSSV